VGRSRPVGGPSYLLQLRGCVSRQRPPGERCASCLAWGARLRSEVLASSSKLSLPSSAGRRTPAHGPSAPGLVPRPPAGLHHPGAPSRRPGCSSAGTARARCSSDTTSSTPRTCERQCARSRVLETGGKTKARASHSRRGFGFPSCGGRAFRTASEFVTRLPKGPRSSAEARRSASPVLPSRDNE